MLAAWMLYATLLTSLIYLGALAAETIVGIWGGRRRLVWAFSLLAAMSAPMVLATRHAAPAAASGAARFVMQSSARLAPALPRMETAPSTVSDDGGPVRRGQVSPIAQIAATVEPYLVGTWLGSSALLLSVFFGALRCLRRRASCWRETELDGARVLVAPDAGPAVVGFVRPSIVIPAWSLSLHGRARALMLRHELEHLRARDPQLLLVAALSLVLCPWNLGLWIITRRLRLAMEIDCDRRVLRATNNVREYGLLLLAVGARRSGALPLGTALVERQPLLERRIRAMTTAPSGHPFRRSLALLAGIICVTVAASTAPRPRPMRAFVRNSASLLVMQRHVGKLDTSAAEHRVEGQQILTSMTRLRPEPRDTTADGQRAASKAGREPRVTVEWENAAIDDVIAAFSRFSGRTIRLSREVTGTVSARVTDQPWDVALELIMSAHGYMLIRNSDGSISISSRAEPGRDSINEVQRLSAAPQAAAVGVETRHAGPIGGRAENREISGRVVEEGSVTPIGAAEVIVIGRQAIGEANRACTNERGEFRMRVPDGEVWLDASAPTFDFHRVTLGPADTTAEFRGRRNATRPLAGISRDEIESVRPQRSRVIDIEDFVDLADVDPVYFEKSYVLVPQRDAEKPYALLLEAMERAGRVGIGRFVLRTKPHLVAIRPAGGVLGLETLFFGDEVRDGRTLVPRLGDTEISERELELAQMLIDTLKTKWDPSRYSDTYRDELLRRIAEKAPAATTESGRVDAPGARILELMDALKASVEEARKAKKSTKKRSA